MGVGQISCLRLFSFVGDSIENSNADSNTDSNDDSKTGSNTDSNKDSNADSNTDSITIVRSHGSRTAAGPTHLNRRGRAAAGPRKP